jgi:hypothetical protein
VASKKTGNPVGRPKGAVSLDGKGGYLVTLGRRVVDQLKAVRGPGESYSDVTLRLAKPSLESPERYSPPALRKNIQDRDHQH